MVLWFFAKLLLMLTVSLVSQKGGAGKTTLAVSLAVAHELAGGSAVVVDLDPQGSAGLWSDLRKTDQPVVVAAHAPRRCARTRGRAPCRASVADLHAIKASLDICRVAGVPARVVLNAIPVQGPLAGQAREAMAEYRAEAAPTMLCQRVAHVHSFTKGMSAMEFSPQSKAAAELQALYRWGHDRRR